MRSTHLEQYLEIFTTVMGLKIPDDIKEKKNLLLDILHASIKNLDAIETPQTIKAEVGTMFRFLTNGCKIYKICEEFGLDLNSVDLDVPIHYLPTGSDSFCIEFPDWFKEKQSDGSYIKTCYVDYSDDVILDGERQRSLRLQFPDYTSDGRLLETVSYINIGLETYTHVSEAINNCPNLDGNFDLNKKAVLFAMKCILYIHSGEPDLRKVKHVDPPKTKKPKKLKRYYEDNKGEFFDYTQVGYNHKKSRMFKAGEVGVRGHYRWQPYGPDRKLYKLIWINAHTRNYTMGASPSL